MNSLTSFSGTPDDLKAILVEVVKPLVEQIRELELKVGSRKHAYTVAEVGKQIGYHPKTVLEFIHTGRRARNNEQIRLHAKEISKGVYRILPDDLDTWLSNF